MASSKAQRRRAGQEAARAKVAAMRAEQERADRRKRLGIVAAVLAGVLVVVGGIVAIAVFDSGTRDTDSAQQSGDLPTAVLKAATSVPASVLEQIGKGSAVSLPEKASGTALTKDGKPQVLYVGAEYCPYCAAERWSMVVALSRFGTFSGLGATTSAAEDVFPNTPTFTFHGSTFSSDYIDFVGKELNTNQREGNGYAPLDKLTSEQQAEFDKLTGGEGSFPFVDFAGKYVVRGTQYDPKVLEGKSMEQIAGALKDPRSPVAQAINGSANTITAALCETSGGRPANVCDSSAIKTLRGQLGGE